ncbi:bifunctional methylenetetrahydrofolate dehydrogenase/methenyltetrahydrofolate cyclohydrolase [bacterium]|nr:bifunctional methylenetetrahydrofolate dehydrogenase/methenyltetrahydrofolate cyclohydrolase [bacterium]
MTKILDGKKVSEQIFEKIKKEVAKLSKKPKLAVILVGDNPASQIYVNIKQKRAIELGFDSVDLKYPENITEQDLLTVIENLNNDKSVNAILVQLPLPKTINTAKVIEAIAPQKDVDGFHPENIGKLTVNQNPYVVACTARGILELLNYYNINVEGKNVVVIGRSNIVGTPVARLLQNKNATVTVCHSKTVNIKEHTLNADIVVCAIGQPKFLKEDMVKERAVIIDVGINRIDDNKASYTICGDTDFENLLSKASYITPVPKGVGPMTIAGLMQNTFDLYKLQNN